MAIIATVSNHFKFQLSKGAINLSSDTLIAILMDATFMFDKDTHATLADVTAHQLATKNGYTRDTKVIVSTLTEDDVNDKAALVCTNITWAATDITDATGLGPIGAWCIIDTTTADSTLVACIDLGVDYTIDAGSELVLQTIALSIV